jgi:hypothetical protein
MSETEIKKDKGEGLVNMINKPFNRRNFLVFAGISAAAFAVGIQGCKSDEIITPSGSSVDLGSGDVGILNYAYALEQLEAAFYIQAVANPYSGMTGAELSILTDIRDHEIAHRDFFKAAIPSSSRIQDLEVNFSSINFTSRASVLGTAKAFEDLGVSAYNGAGYYITEAAYLELAGKIVSVEARHAAAIRDLLNPRSADFAGDDIVNASTGLDVQRKPSQVLPIAATYLKTSVTANNLP